MLAVLGSIKVVVGAPASNGRCRRATVHMAQQVCVSGTGLRQGGS